MVRFLCPRRLRFLERDVLRRHLDLSTGWKLLDGEYLHARIVPPPPLRAVVPCAYGLLIPSTTESARSHHPGGRAQSRTELSGEVADTKAFGRRRMALTPTADTP